MKQFYEKNLKFIVILLISMMHPAFAATPDDQEPIVIESKMGEYDNKKGAAKYSGNVRVLQGSRELLADTLLVYRNENGRISKLIAIGEPAKYSGQTDPNRPKLYAKAATIEYLAEEELLNLIDNAEVSQDGDIYQAARIEYNIKNDTVTSPPSQDGRVKIILKPRSNSELKMK